MLAAMSKGGIVAIAVIAGVVIAVICYYIARALKGKLTLVLKQKSAASGSTIGGSLSVMTKKALCADRLYVGLIGEREERRRSSNGGTSRSWREFYRDEADVFLDEELPAGFSETYEFELVAPSEAQVMSGAQALSKVADAMGDGAVGTMVKGIASVEAMVGGSRGGRKRWKVISRLETKGVDLAASEKIHISLKSI